MFLKKIINKIISIPKLIMNEGLDALYFRILSNLGFKLKYRSTIEKRKYLLDKKIAQLTGGKVLYGLYKGSHLNSESNWFRYGGFSNRFLGCYEEQVQTELNKLSSENNLVNIVCFGAADGYHILGLLKNHIFKFGYAFEIDKINCSYLLENAKKNKLSEKLKIFCEKANFNSLKKYLTHEDLKKTLFLIDIEGDEYDLFDEDNIDNYKKSFFIIEDHIFYDKKDKRNNFYNLINKNFNVHTLRNSSRNPHNYEILNKFNDDDKWLLMGESRPETMNWIILTPLNN